MGKERSLSWIAPTAFFCQRASRQQGTKRNRNRRAIASHQEDQRFAEEIAPQTEVNSSSTVVKFPYQKRQQIMVGNQIQEVVEPSFCLNPPPNCDVVALRFRRPLVLKRKLIFPSINSDRNRCIVVLHKTNAREFIPGPDVGLGCPAGQFARSL